MTEEILIRFRWTVDEVAAAYRWNFRHRVRPVFRLGFWVLAGMCLCYGASQLWGTNSFFPGGVLLLVGIYIPLSLLVIRPWLVRRQFSKRPDRNSEVEWRISADAIHVRVDHGSSDSKWQAIAKVVQTPKGFLFYPTEQIFHWLPRHGFVNDADFDLLSDLAKQRAAAFHCIYRSRLSANYVETRCQLPQQLVHLAEQRFRRCPARFGHPVQINVCDLNGIPLAKARNFCELIQCFIRGMTIRLVVTNSRR